MQKKILDHIAHIAHIAHISSWRLPLRFLSPWTAFHRRRRRHVYEARSFPKPRCDSPLPILGTSSKWRWWLERSTAKAGNIEIMWKYVKICESYCSWLGWFSELSGVDFWLLDKCWGNYQTILASKSLQHCLNTIRFFHISHAFPGKVPETLAKPSQWAISNSFFFPGWASRRGYCFITFSNIQEANSVPGDVGRMGWLYHTKTWKLTWRYMFMWLLIPMGDMVAQNFILPSGNLT